jgi:hypothetical protein
MRMTSKIGHMLIQDDDGHWYVISEDRQEDFDRWRDAMTDASQGVWLDEWQPKRVNGPHVFKFYDWVQE